jgi:hypothetical protein
MTIAKGMLKVKSGDTFVQFHPETSSDMVTGFRDAVRENLPISVYSSNTAYAVNDCAFFEELPKWAYLRCTKAGTTGATVPAAFSSSATLDQTINDGTVTWVVCKHGVPIDAKLKSIIANTITADSLLYGTGANTFGITALSALARTLIGKANAADMRSTLSAAAASHSHSVGDITNFASQVITAIGDQTLSALGVRYSITTNGYICFGDLFGGLILQWSQGTGGYVSYPISFSEGTFTAAFQRVDTNSLAHITYCVTGHSVNGITFNTLSHFPFDPNESITGSNGIHSGSGFSTLYGNFIVIGR